MRETSRTLATSGFASSTWEDLPVVGQVLISTICAKIASVETVIAEVSDLNSNVLFEAGYALAKNKNLWLTIDNTDAEALQRWKDIGILSTVGRFDYSGNSENLLTQWYEHHNNQMSPLLETLLNGGRPREPDAIFAPASPVKFQAASALERFFERQSHLHILGSGEDFGLAPLDFYVKEIYRSSACIFHLLAPKRVRAAEHNARISFLAGIAHGFELPVLMVVEEGFISPLDYRDMLFSYSSSAQLQAHVDNWLRTLPKKAGSNKRLGRLDLDIELPIRSFGQYVAEYETDELTDYFVETAEFQSVLRGAAKVFIGRKGTGKTATMSQAVMELRKDRRNLVASIKPSSYELNGLTDAVRALDSETGSEYLMLSLWTYLLYTEIGLRTVIYANERPAKTGTSQSLLDLESELEDLGVIASDDLSTRLEKAIEILSSEARRDGEAIQKFISRQLRMHRLTKLKNLILTTLKDFDRVAVLIDNLDKAWERGADYRIMSKFILSLLTAVGRVEKDFSKPPPNTSPVNLSLTVFLRTDIYDAIAKFAREPDKIGVLSVQWQDEELLARVLEERYSANRASKNRIDSSSMWDELFAAEVRGLVTRDYFLWRVLPRPRDFVFFANAALTTAINRKHNQITEPDIVFAEKQYSRFAVEALLVESEAEKFDLEEVLYEFAGLDSTLEFKEVCALLSRYEHREDVVDWLVQGSFLGLEVRPGEFIHVEGETAARRQMKVAKRFSEKSGAPLRVRVHPAFRGYLEVLDDDLHDESIRDATLVTGEDISPVAQPGLPRIH